MDKDIVVENKEYPKTCSTCVCWTRGKTVLYPSKRVVATQRFLGLRGCVNESGGCINSKIKYTEGDAPKGGLAFCDGECYSATLITHQDFGCVNWKGD